MTPYRKRQTEATRRMAEDMTIRNFAVSTMIPTPTHVDRFSKHFGKMPKISVLNKSVSSSSGCAMSMNLPGVNSIRLFAHYVSSTRHAARPWVVTMIPFGKSGKKLPTCPQPSQVHQLIQCVHHPNIVL